MPGALTRQAALVGGRVVQATLRLAMGPQMRSYSAQYTQPLLRGRLQFFRDRAVAINLIQPSLWQPALVGQRNEAVKRGLCLQVLGLRRRQLRSELILTGLELQDTRLYKNLSAR